MTKELDSELHNEIKTLCSEGDSLAKEEKQEEAKAKYITALKLLPSHPSDWEAATWIYTAIGDTHFRLGNYEKMMKCFFNAVQCPGGLGNPYVHLRLGQSYYELNDLDKAADELARAYMGGGMDIMLEDDPKYLEFLETKIEI